ncbi:MAG: 4Fe-4S dicluster domain-containing protein [Deltaproteobacteria bacterium]|nr:4Fe-4S dicluster domain-containing protein [Deltaproteobacteria bacterium]
MSAKIFSKDEWAGVLEGLKDAYEVYVPVKEGDFHNFRPLKEGTRPSFEFQNTRMSPKFLTEPQSERMFEYTLDKNQPDAHILKEDEKEIPPRAVVGIRPCDAFAFQLVKRNFDTPRYKDPYWLKRYEATTFVGLGCNDPCETCFCASAGSGPFDRKGLDVLLYDLGDAYLAQPLTDKGEALLEKTDGGKEADEASWKKAQGLTRQVAGKGSRRVSTDKLREKDVNALYEAPFWEDVAFSCINCGTCTFLCPTCWCFDIQDEVQMLPMVGDRMRNWDSCMFPLFTLHGSGHNPRSSKTERVRQRFMHKLKYYVDKYDDGIQCVGCGRCVQFCPVNIDIREIAEKMNAL